MKDGNGSGYLAPKAGGAVLVAISTSSDTVAGGPPRIYRNALDQFGSFGDIEAFPAP